MKNSSKKRNIRSTAVYKKIAPIKYNTTFYGLFVNYTKTPLSYNDYVEFFSTFKSSINLNIFDLIKKND